MFISKKKLKELESEIRNATDLAKQVHIHNPTEFSKNFHLKFVKEVNNPHMWSRSVQEHHLIYSEEICSSCGCFYVKTRKFNSDSIKDVEFKKKWDKENK